MPIVKFHHEARDIVLRTWGESDAIHQHLASTGTFYEDYALRFIRDRRLQGTYVDVGANIGNHAVYFAALCPASLVVAIEGNPAIVPVLEENLRNNRKPSKPIWLLPRFVSSRPEVFFTQADDTNVGASFVGDSPANASSEKFRTSTLDSVCLALPRVDLIKVDVEDHELEVLKSGITTLRQHHPEIYVESFDNNYPALRDWLADLGYLELTTFENYNHYLVHVGHFGVWIDRALLFLPFALHSRLRWRWNAFACGVVRLLTVRRRLAAEPCPPSPAAPLRSI
jgi:FkbM family methyltransferase